MWGKRPSESPADDGEPEVASPLRRPRFEARAEVTLRIAYDCA